MRKDEPSLMGVTITGVTRLTNSRDGNPRFDIVFSDGTVATTQADASVNYDVENVRNSGERVNVYLTRAGQVYKWDRVDGEAR